MLKDKITKSIFILSFLLVTVFSCLSGISAEESSFFPVHDKPGFFLSILNHEYPESIFSNPANLSLYNNYLAELGYYSENPGIFSVKIIFPSERNGVWGLGIYDNGHSGWDRVNEVYLLHENVTVVSYSPNLPFDFIKAGLSLGFMNFKNDIAFDSPFLNLGFSSDFKNRKDYLKNIEISCVFYNITNTQLSSKAFGTDIPVTVPDPINISRLNLTGIAYNFHVNRYFNITSGYEYNSEDHHIFIINSQ
ncbi:MAG TPA: hypothetical protein ENN73_03260, partial [Firmicutes bacterium]|nr:hypothetical protein [Bacillota bacterium]